MPESTSASDNSIAANVGEWATVGLSGVVGTHAALLHTGEVIFFTRPEDPSHNWSRESQNPNPNGLSSDDLQPHRGPDVTLSTIVSTSGADAFKPRALPLSHNPFCAGLTILSDGALLVAGGDKKDETYAGAPTGTTYGLHSLRLFTRQGSSNADEWKDIGDISDSRWYPTCALLPDGRVFIISGSLDDEYAYNNQNPTCETVAVASLPSASAVGSKAQYLPLLVEAWPYHSYPFVYVLPSGKLFLFVKDSVYYLRSETDEFGEERWEVQVGPNLGGEPSKQYPNTATSVLLPLFPNDDQVKAYAAEVLLIGGGGKNEYPQWNSWNRGARSNCFRLSVHPADERAEWRACAPMKNPRVMPDAVLLPDGTVLVINGSMKGYAGGNAGTGVALPQDAAKEAELYHADKDEWTTLATASKPRLYHSTALLMPDGRVLIAGSDQQTNVNKPDFPSLAIGTVEYNRHVAGAYEYELEVFSPPYLFKDIPRPALESVPDQIDYSERFEVQVSDLVNLKPENLGVSLLRPGAVTHCNNVDQRYVGLKIVGKSLTQLTLEGPPNPCVAPPGYYMLFLLDRGVPSEAKFVKLQSGTVPRRLKTNIPTGKTLDPATRSSCVQPPLLGTALWLRADNGIVADGKSIIQSWADRSGQGNDVFAAPNAPTDPNAHPLQRPPEWLPHELNGQSVVRFSIVYGSPDEQAWGGRLQSSRPFLPGNGPYSAFVVTQPWPPGHSFGFDLPNSRGPWGDLLGWGDFTNPTSNAFVGVRFGPGPRKANSDLLDNPGNASVLNYWSADWQFGDVNRDPLVSLSTPLTLEAFFDGVNTGIRLNGTVIKQDPAPLGGRNTGAGPVSIGLNGHVPFSFTSQPPKVRGAFFRGDIAEILVYNRALSDAERADVQRYFQTRYSIQ